MSLQKSIMLALLAAGSLSSFSIANATENFLNSDIKKNELQSAAILLGVYTPPPKQVKPQANAYRRPVVKNQSQAYQLRQHRLLNKRKRENLQRLYNKKRRLNHRKQVLRQLASRRGYRYNYVSRVSPIAGNSVWHRVRNGFRLRNDSYRPSVQRAIQQFKKHPERLTRTLNRSSEYLHLVVTELERRRMPTDLVLLPMVESAYKNKARSHAGAVGLWQFISSTGRRYGLKQTRGYDGRMDILESTRAAMDYLQKLHREFRGDWLLALAAYNCGENRVHREIERNRARGLPTDYWHLSLPRETKNYVPKLLAYREVIRTPRSFGVRLPSVVNRPQLVQVHVNKAVDLKKVAKNAGVHPSVITRLNPAYKYGVTMPSMTRRMVLPRQHANNIQRAIQRTPTVSPAKLVHYAKASSRRYRSRRIFRYRVRSGESLSTIAAKYGTTVKKLMRLNRLRNSRIRAGKRIRIASIKRVKLG